MIACLDQIYIFSQMYVMKSKRSNLYLEVNPTESREVASELLKLKDLLRRTAAAPCLD